MIQKKRLLALAMSLVLSVGVLSNVSAAADVDSTGERLICDGVKYKTARQAAANEVFSDTRKGLLLQSYGSGSVAAFKETFSDTFEIEMKALAKETRPAISELRLLFTDVTDGSTFSVGIKDTGTETSAYVVVDEEIAGISYATDYDDKAHGFTTSQNEAGVYTKVVGAHTTDILFDPDTMEVRIKNQGGQEEYKTIWCLTKDVVDGRRWNHVLSPFDQYTVQIEFTQVASGEKGELLIYNVNGEDYGESTLPPVYASVNPNLTYEAVAGKKYTLPKASVYGMDDTPEITCTVNDENGKELAFGKVEDGISFTPKHAGTYYLYYSVKGQEKAGTYVTLQAYDAAEINARITSCDALTESVGVHTTMKIPARTVQSSLIREGVKIYTDLTVKKDGKVQKEQKNLQKPLDYQFEEAGVYTVIWSATLNGKEYTDSMNVKADTKIPSVSGIDVRSAYEKDTDFEIPAATVYVNGETLQTSATLYKPSGEKVTEEKTVLDEIGVYNLVYTYELKGKEKKVKQSFSVDYGSENIFTAGEDTKVSYDDTKGNADYPGVQIEMTSKNAVATYAKTLDLSDNTKTDELIRLYLVPNTVGTRDLSGFYITLTDRLNPENQISIRVIAGDGNMSSGSYVRVKATGQDGYLGLYKDHTWDQEPYSWTDQIEASMAHDKGGYTTDLDFAYTSPIFDFDTKILSLRYDAKEKAIYGSQRVKLEHDASYREELIADLDDPSLYKNLWGGFTDDSQVELSISPVSVSGTATFKILSVDGLDLSAKVLADTTAPDVTVDLKGMDEVPTGKVGTAYPIFDLIATDNLCTDESLIKNVVVKHNGKTVKVTDGAFLPTEEGTYQIQYAVSDGFGNTTRKNVNVPIKSSVPKMKIRADRALSDSITYGMAYEVPEFTGVGGTGCHTLRSYYIYNGEEKEFTSSFVPMEEGSYTVVCEAKDYIGQTAKLSRTLDVVFRPEILFKDSSIVLPEVIAAEQTFGFDKYVASYYEAVGEKEKTTGCRITVTDAEGTRELAEDRLYVPKLSKSVKKAKICFSFEAEVKGEKIEKTVTKEVKLTAISSDNQFMTGYFTKENAQIRALNRYTVITAANRGDATVSYIRPVQVKEFSLILKAEQAGKKYLSDFEHLVVTLTDKNHKDEKVRFTVTKHGSGLEISINNQRAVTLPGSLTAESMQNLEIGYKNADYTVNGAENTSVGTVTTYLNGKEFKGFTSQEAYVEITLAGAAKGSGIDLISMNNQTFLGAMQDTIDPDLFVNGSYSGIFTEGTKLTLPTANAYDVLNYVTTPTLTVASEAGEVLTATDGTKLENVAADKEYEICLDKLGRYNVSYSAEDASGRKTVVQKTIEILDDVLPTMELKGTYKDVSAGKTVKVKKYKLQDNGNTDKIEVLTYVGAPDGTMTEVKNGKIKTEKKGCYTVYYFMTDENGNKNVASFAFEAK